MPTSGIKTTEVLYITVLELKQHYGNLRLSINTPNDIKKIADKQKWFDSIENEFRQAVAALQIPEGMSEVDAERLKNEHVNQVLYQPSSVKKEDLAILNDDEFFQAVKALNLNNKEIAFLSNWFIKED